MSTKNIKLIIIEKNQQEVLDHEPGQILGDLTYVLGQRSLTLLINRKKSNYLPL